MTDNRVGIFYPGSDITGPDTRVREPYRGFVFVWAQFQRFKDADNLDCSVLQSYFITTRTYSW